MLDEEIHRHMLINTTTKPHNCNMIDNKPQNYAPQNDIFKN
jgi:hypothetical protein